VSREHVFAIALSAGSTAVVFLLSPAWGSFFLAVSIAAFVLYWHSGRGKVPRIEQYPVRDALNFKITNGTVKAGLGGVELRLNRLQRWDGHRTEFGTVSGYRPMVLYSDQVDLPYQITRTFQILDVTDRQNPRVHGKLNGKEHWWPLGGYGVWAADLDLLWGWRALCFHKLCPVD
jgi:hypothetical protein